MLTNIELCDGYLKGLQLLDLFERDVLSQFILEFLLNFNVNVIKFITKTFRNNLPRRQQQPPGGKEPDKEDRQVIYYIAGSIMRGYLKIAKRSNKIQTWQSVASVLRTKVLIDKPDGDFDPDSEWTKEVDRGGLLYINSQCQSFFVKLTKVIFACEKSDGSINYDEVIARDCVRGASRVADASESLVHLVSYAALARHCHRVGWLPSRCFRAMPPGPANAPLSRHGMSVEIRCGRQYGPVDGSVAIQATLETALHLLVRGVKVGDAPIFVGVYYPDGTQLVLFQPAAPEASATAHSDPGRGEPSTASAALDVPLSQDKRPQPARVDAAPGAGVRPGPNSAFAVWPSGTPPRHAPRPPRSANSVLGRTLHPSVRGGTRIQSGKFTSRLKASNKIVAVGVGAHHQHRADRSPGQSAEQRGTVPAYLELKLKDKRPQPARVDAAPGAGVRPGPNSAFAVWPSGTPPRHAPRPPRSANSVLGRTLHPSVRGGTLTGGFRVANSLQGSRPPIRLSPLALVPTTSTALIDRRKEKQRFTCLEESGSAA
ncbi:hypothetical protein FOCC_FOCC016967 [Frankliniella occidentalis]|nr:hypothetical protein FOCC_FOCC016967 [Frankliniella occidentalis]